MKRTVSITENNNNSRCEKVAKMATRLGKSTSVDRVNFSIA